MIQRLLGHAGPEMPAVYAHLHVTTSRANSNGIARPGSTRGPGLLGFDPQSVTANAARIKQVSRGAAADGRAVRLDAGAAVGSIMGMGHVLRTVRGGTGAPTLLLIHGLGATGDVWDGVQRLLPGRWPGRWLVPDLPGHGGSEPLDRYTFDAMTAAVADEVGAADTVLVVGHSLGGVVGINLAGGRFGVRTIGVIGLGIKVSWTPDELARATAMGQRPVQWFETRDAATQRYLRVSGLAGLVEPTDPIIDHGIAHDHDHNRWRMTMDPAAFAVGAPDMPRLLAEARSAVVLARGEHDTLVTDGQLAALPAESVTVPGLGHNAHLQDPEAVLSLLTRMTF